MTFFKEACQARTLILANHYVPVSLILAGQFGAPLVGGVGIFVGMLAATLSSVIESIGDYYATARICQLPPPPKHAMNRGIAMEGFASVIAGFVGTCHGTTSLSQMVGFIGQTGVCCLHSYLDFFSLINLL